MSVQAVIDAITIELVLAAFAGGAFGAALGALPAFIFTGFMVIAGEAANLAMDQTAGITGAVAFGPVFGPHISFAGGAAAAAYAANRGYMQSGFDYHNAKDITFALGTKPDVLAVGGAFGILGMLIRQVSFNFGMPWDPIAMGVTLSALAHRLALGYDVVGDTSRGLFNMAPFREEVEREDGSGRLLVEPWLPHMYKWGNVAAIGLVTGILGGYIYTETGSVFLGFGISAASLLFLNLGVEQIPVTHHMTLPASTAAASVMASGDAVLANAGVPTAVVVAAVFGLLGALVGEVWQRIFYSHGDTHWDPPAAAITIMTFVIAVMFAAGVFAGHSWVPYP